MWWEGSLELWYVVWSSALNICCSLQRRKAECFISFIHSFIVFLLELLLVMLLISHFSFQKNQRFAEDLFQIDHLWSGWFQRTNFKGLSYYSSSLLFVLTMSCVFTVVNWFLLMQIPLRDCKKIEFVEKENNPFAEWVGFSVCSFSCWHLFRVLNQLGELMTGESSVKASMMTLSCYFLSSIRSSGRTF